MDIQVFALQVGLDEEAFGFLIEVGDEEDDFLEGELLVDEDADEFLEVLHLEGVELVEVVECVGQDLGVGFGEEGVDLLILRGGRV